MLSSEALVDLYAQLSSDEDATSTQTALATDLRTTFVGNDADRLAMLRQFWEPAITQVSQSDIARLRG